MAMRPFSPVSASDELSEATKSMVPHQKGSHPERSRRRVSFSDQISEVPHPTNVLTQQEIRSSWYQSHEKTRMKQEINLTLRMIKNGIMFDESQFCSRGIEHFLNLKDFMKQRCQTIRSVLTEQDFQMNEGICDQHALAVSSKEFSSRHQEKARLKGLNDQRGASKCHSSNWRIKTSTFYW